MMPRMMAKIAATTMATMRIPILDPGARICQGEGRSSSRRVANAWKRAVFALMSLSVSGI